MQMFAGGSDFTIWIGVQTFFYLFFFVAGWIFLNWKVGAEVNVKTRRSAVCILIICFGLFCTFYSLGERRAEEFDQPVFTHVFEL